MGYRSDVAYVVKFHSDSEPEKAFAQFLAFQEWVKRDHVVYRESVTNNKQETIPHGYPQEDGHFKIHSDELMMSFCADGVKWYESYADVQWHEQLLEKIHEYETGNYRFVCIGEEYEDIEVRQHDPTVFELFDHVDVCRSISFSPPSEPLTKEAA